METYTTKQIPVQLKRLPHGQDIDLPVYQSADAAGADLHAAVTEDTTIPPGQIAFIPCGIAIAIPQGYEVQIRPRSGLAAKHGITLPNTPGTIDADYRGEIMVPLINHSQSDFTVTRNMRVAQMLIKPIYHIQWEEVNELSDTVRGQGGFGHTGH